MGELFESLPAAKRGAHAVDAAALAPLVDAALRPGDSVLVKGSYGSRMRDIIAVLQGLV
jgi:UDP-N-acetylmuramoyl-tripeptide--D-alanyl-D-alanine ligase